MFALHQPREGAHVVEAGQLVPIGEGADPALRHMHVLGQQGGEKGDQQKRQQGTHGFCNETQRQRIDAAGPGCQHQITGAD